MIKIGRRLAPLHDNYQKKKKTSRKRRKDGWLKSSRNLIARLDNFSTVRQKELEITIQSSLFGKKPVKKKAVRQKTHWVQKPTGYGHIQWIKNETNRLLYKKRNCQCGFNFLFWQEDRFEIVLFFALNSITLVDEQSNNMKFNLIETKHCGNPDLATFCLQHIFFSELSSQSSSFWLIGSCYHRTTSKFQIWNLFYQLSQVLFFFY